MTEGVFLCVRCHSQSWTERQQNLAREYNHVRKTLFSSWYCVHSHCLSSLHPIFNLHSDFHLQFPFGSLILNHGGDCFVRVYLAVASEGLGQAHCLLCWKNGSLISTPLIDPLTIFFFFPSVVICPKIQKF